MLGRQQQLPSLVVDAPAQEVLLLAPKPSMAPCCPRDSGNRPSTTFLQQSLVWIILCRVWHMGGVT